jgi:LacI family transcriptional regulator
MSTIADVAAAAGVSKATVSRVLSGNTPYLRAETRQRVEQAIAELSFRPSSVARSLTSKRTYTVGMLISDVGNPFYADVIHGVEDIGLSAGYNTFLCNTNYDLQRGQALVHSLIDRRVDGVLIMSSTMSADWLEELARHTVPVVVVDWNVEAARQNLSAIRVDFRPGIQAAVAHLIELGHRRFAHISGLLQLPTSRVRRDAFLHALAEFGIAANKAPVIESDFHVDGGRAAVQHLLNLRQPPTAIFAANDLMAMGAMAEARTLGLKVPADLSVVGLDDIWQAAQTEPPLTTVALPRYEIGSLAMQLLLDLLKREPGQTAAPVIARVETHLVLRGSTAALKSNRTR